MRVSPNLIFKLSWKLIVLLDSDSSDDIDQGDGTLCVPMPKSRITTGLLTTAGPSSSVREGTTSFVYTFFKDGKDA